MNQQATNSKEARNKFLREELKQFLNSDNFELKPINSGASIRHYYQLYFTEKKYFPLKNVILMVVPTEKIEIADDYLNISCYLGRYQIPHPRLFEMRRDKGWIFLAPASGEQLDIYLRNHPNQINTLYPKILNFIMNLQIKAKVEEHCPAFSRYFDREKYLYEFNFHIKEQLINHYFNHQFLPDEEKLFNNFAEDVSTLLESKFPVFVHRDFQSSNIFFNKNDKNQPFMIIDFQDARRGSYTYDLVSLLWDSYVEIPNDLRVKLLSDFYRKHQALQEHYTFKQYLNIIDYQVIQRKLHDAGAFVLAYRLLQNKNYLPYIDQAIEMAISVMKKFTKFELATQLFQKIMGQDRD